MLGLSGPQEPPRHKRQRLRLQGPVSAVSVPWKLLRFSFLSAGKTYPFFSRLCLVKGWDLDVDHTSGIEEEF